MTDENISQPNPIDDDYLHYLEDCRVYREAFSRISAAIYDRSVRSWFDLMEITDKSIDELRSNDKIDSREYLGLQRALMQLAHKFSEDEEFDARKRKEKDVYIIQSGITKHIKIGHSINVTQRVKSLKTSSPERLLLLGVVKDKALTERDIHKEFSDDRVKGEWFNPSPRLLEWIHDNVVPV